VDEAGVVETAALVHGNEDRGLGPQLRIAMIEAAILADDDDDVLDRCGGLDRIGGLI